MFYEINIAKINDSKITKSCDSNKDRPNPLRYEMKTRWIISNDA